MNTHRSLDRSRRRPRVLVVGGDDVDARLDLMSRLAGSYEMVAAGSDDSLAERFTSRGFRFEPFPMKRAVSPFSDLRTFWSLFRICRRIRPDIVHAYATKPAVWGRLAAGAAGVPVIVGTIPGLGSLYSAGGGMKRLVRPAHAWLNTAASACAQATVFQNESDRSEMIGRGIVDPERAYLIPGSGVRTDLLRREALDPRDVSAVRQQIGATGKAPVVTMVARLIRPKGVLEFASAARRLHDTHSSARFVLVGPADADSVDRLTEDEMRQIEDTVAWLGERSDVPNVLAASDVFVLPSYYREGVPRVLLEAASMGLPLVAARVPGSMDVVEHDVNGLLVEPKDIAGLANAIRSLLDDADLRARLGAAARDRVIHSFDTRVVANLTGELYRSLLERHSGTRRPLGGFEEGSDGGSLGSIAADTDR